MPYRRVLITGASGFIGSRLCEKFTLQYRLPYRALVHNFSGAARIARLGADMIGGDVLNPMALDKALSGCDAVVHLAYTGGKDGEKILLAACRRAGVRRFIHISSMAVHGPNPGPECAHETTATIHHHNEPYSDAKARAERAVQRAILRGLPGVILRPTIVYGPYSPFVTRIVESARAGAITLIDNGLGICNAIYIDDVCDAIHSALFCEKALGKAFFVTADRAVAWHDFNLTFARMVSPDVAVSNLTAKEIRAHWSAQKASIRSNVVAFGRLLASPDFHDQLQTVPALGSGIRWSKRTLKRLLSNERVAALQAVGGTSTVTDPVQSWPDIGRLVREDFRLEFSNELAKRVLGWKPAFDLAAGAAVTRTWLEFAGFVQPLSQSLRPDDGIFHK